MTFYVLERANGGKLVKECETREEAKKVRDELIAEDPRYADVLYITTDELAPPLLGGHGRPDEPSGGNRDAVQKASRDPRRRPTR